MSSEISLGKFPEIYSNLSGNLLHNFFHFIIFNYHHRKKFKISMFLTNNSPDLCFLTLCIKIGQNNLYLASFPRISANLNKNYRPYNFQALANISGNLRKIYNPTTNAILILGCACCAFKYIGKVRQLLTVKVLCSQK